MTFSFPHYVTGFYFEIEKDITERPATFNEIDRINIEEHPRPCATLVISVCVSTDPFDNHIGIDGARLLELEKVVQQEIEEHGYDWLIRKIRVIPDNGS